MSECGFPAKELVSMRRRVAERADASHDLSDVRECCGCVKAIEELRLYHEDATGCRCWYEAVERGQA